MDANVKNPTSAPELITSPLTTDVTSAHDTTIDEETTTTFAYPADDRLLWFGIRPEYIIIPCIVLGIPLLILLCCLFKSAARKKIKADEEPSKISKKYVPPDIKNGTSKIKHGPAVTSQTNKRKENNNNTNNKDKSLRSN